MGYFKGFLKAWRVLCWSCIAPRRGLWIRGFRVYGIWVRRVSGLCFNGFGVEGIWSYGLRETREDLGCSEVQGSDFSA